MRIFGAGPGSLPPVREGPHEPPGRRHREDRGRAADILPRSPHRALRRRHHKGQKGGIQNPETILRRENGYSRRHPDDIQGLRLQAPDPYGRAQGRGRDLSFRLQGRREGPPAAPAVHGQGRPQGYSGRNDHSDQPGGPPGLPYAPAPGGGGPPGPDGGKAGIRLSSFFQNHPAAAQVPGQRETGYSGQRGIWDLGEQRIPGHLRSRCPAVREDLRGIRAAVHDQDGPQPELDSGQRKALQSAAPHPVLGNNYRRRPRIKINKEPVSPNPDPL